MKQHLLSTLGSKETCGETTDVKNKQIPRDTETDYFGIDEYSSLVQGVIDNSDSDSYFEDGANDAF